MLRVGVLRGGPSHEYEVSLRSGQNILDNFYDDFETKDILIDKSGGWYLEGLPIAPEKAIKKFDVFFNCLHGTYGEDGKIQQFLSSVNMPFTGSGTMAGAISMNKFLAKRAFVLGGLKVPEHVSLKVSHDLDRNLKDIFSSWVMPVVIKPKNSGSSFGVSFAYDFNALKKAVSDAFNYSNEVMVEEYIRGREASCAVLERFRGEDLYALPVIEINSNDQIVPGRFSKEEKKEIARIAKEAHQILGLKHYSKSDFIISRGGIYILETNALPGLHEESGFKKSLESIGSNLKEFTNHVVNLALGR